MADINDFRDKCILITGASGFIGSLLCERLSKLGAAVHGISRRRLSSSEDYIQWHQADISDAQQVQNIFSSVKPNIIYHLASEVTGSRDLKMVLPVLYGNLVSTVNLLIAASEGGCHRLVIAGSLEEPEGECSKVIPASPYAAAKGASSAYARMFHALYKTPVTIARLFMVYGPGQKDLQKLVPYTILSLLRGETPRLSSGTRPVDWIHVRDVVEGLLATGLARGLEGQTVELGSGQLTTVRHVVEMLCEIVDPGIQAEFGAIPDRPMEQVRIADINTSHEKSGWKPSIEIRAGLEDTALWYRQRLETGKIRL